MLRRIPFSDFTDDFTGADGPLHGRVSPSGHIWTDTNPGTLEIVSNRLVATVASNPPGSYGAVQVGAIPSKMEAQVSWTGTSGAEAENGGLILICGNLQAGRAGAAPPGAAGGAFNNMIHCVFGCRQWSVNYYQDGVASPAVDFAWYKGDHSPVALDGTVFDIAMTIEGDRLTFLLPNGEERTAWDAAFATISGRNLLYQVFKTGSPTLNPRFESVSATVATRAAPLL